MLCVYTLADRARGKLAQEHQNELEVVGAEGWVRGGRSSQNIAEVEALLAVR